MGTAVAVKGFEIGIVAQFGEHFEVCFTAQDIHPLQSMQSSQPMHVAAGQ